MDHPTPTPDDLDALFASPIPEEIVRAWASLKTDFVAGPLEPVGEPIAEDGVLAQFFGYASAGLNVYGALYRPADTSAGPFPLLLANHGGGNGLGPLRVAPPPGRRPFSTWCWELARAGYVVLASAYRGEPSPAGQSDGTLELRKGEVDDVLQLLACGRALPYVDGERVGMWGDSHGAVISALAAQRSADLRGAIAFYPAIDVIFRGPSPERATRDLLAGVLRDRTPPDALPPFLRMLLLPIFQPWLEGRSTIAQTRQEMIVRSATCFADRTRCPLFLVCGEADPLLEQVIDFDCILAHARKEHEFRSFPAEGHGFNHGGSLEAVAESWRLALDFFARRLPHKGA